MLPHNTAMLFASLVAPTAAQVLSKTLGITRSQAADVELMSAAINIMVRVAHLKSCISFRYHHVGKTGIYMCVHIRVQDTRVGWMSKSPIRKHLAIVPVCP
jgi:hypothetical protein